MGVMDKVKAIFDGESEDSKTYHNTPEESKWVSKILNDQENAESLRDGDEGIEQIWEDEYKIFLGGGKQWETSFAYRSKRARKLRPNSEDNFVFLAIMNLHANITANTPATIIEGVGEEDKEVAEKLTHLSQFNDKRNNFQSLWRKMVLQFISYGPVIGGVLWDNDWTGGTGPDRWVGDVRWINIDRRYIYFDPAIIDLEERLQDCSFITRKPRKKLSYIRDKWEKGKFVAKEVNDDELQDEGFDPQQAYLIEHWHRGLPWEVSAKDKAKFNERADEAEASGDSFRAQDLRDMAKGKLKGIHAAYVAGGVFLGYEPYVYEDGLYPFVYRTLYHDENAPFGFGEIRNTKIPQVMHNKADEIEIEAYSRQGLGQTWYEKDAINSRQKEEILKNSGKGGSMMQVDKLHLIKDREAVSAPSSLPNYKEHKQRMVETVSSNTPIQQGMAPGANVPYATVQELGARTDIRTKQKIEILEDFLIEMNKLRLSRFKQFYTEERYYRLKGKFGEKIDGTFRADEMYKQWEREVEGENGPETKFEMYVPEFDVSVKIIDEKPNDREYYTRTGFELFGAQAMALEDLWFTIEEGEFPPKDQIMKNLAAQNEAMQLAEVLKQVPPEMKDQFMQAQQGLLRQMAGGMGGDIDGFLDQLPDDILQMVQQMDPGQQDQHVKGMMQMQPEELAAHVEQMRGQMQ